MAWGRTSPPSPSSPVAGDADDHLLFKLLAFLFGLAILRDSVYYRWLHCPTIAPIVALAAAIYRIRLVLSSPYDTPSLLTWLQAQLAALFSISSSPTTTIHTPTPTLKITHTFLEDILVLLLLSQLIHLLRCTRRLRFSEIKSHLANSLFSLLQHLPPIQEKMKSEKDSLEASLEHSLRPPGWNGTRPPIHALPTKGLKATEILTLMQGFAGKEATKWKEGKVSGAVYGGEDEIVELMGQASTLYGLTNPLHPDLWPSVMKFESEVCAMVCQMVNGGGEGVVGSLSSGGTESIILAAKTHRDWARATKNITQPEIVACVSAHAAIYKAADLMNIRLILIPMDPHTYQADVVAMERAITGNTIMLYASAPTFSQGVIDPITKISALGQKYQVGVHVDCCLGGFLLPFATKMGLNNLPPFDFSLPGVTSMSVDTHKYGYASKGTSCVCYRDKELRKYQYFTFANWPGGLYVTPTIAGSRPGALSAACWAAMVYVGEEGYMKRAKLILETAQEIAHGVKGIEGVYVQGEVKAMIVCLGGKGGVNIYQVGDLMGKKGWSLNSLQAPAGIHLCVTLRHVGKAQGFLTDLRECAAAVVAEVKKAAAEGRKIKTEGNAAIYGMSATLPAGAIEPMLQTYTDCVLKA